MAYNNSTSIGEIYNLSNKILTENDIFNIGKRKAAQIFLEKLLDLPEGSSDAQLESAYKECSPREKIPENTEEFWTFVEKEYLHLDVEPRIKFTELSFRVNEDLSSVEDNLRYIKQELTSLEEKKMTEGRLNANERYYRNQLEYFKNKNLVAKNEIVDFMTHKIKKYALKKASAQLSVFSSFVAPLFDDSPYAFGRKFFIQLTDPYDVRSLDMYSNKFLDLSIRTHRRIVAECKTSPEKFKEYAVAYINGEPGERLSAREKIEGLIERSHILHSRRKVIETMLRHFEARDYISFVSMAPLQIEGIFADICRGIGISENQLDISSLNDKLQHIDGKMKNFFFFEYYSFKFPVLRNLVAHGGLVDGELEDTAVHLILDLLPVCDLTVSDDMPIIHALGVLDAAGKGDHSKLIEWLDLRKEIDIPAFYNAQEKIASTEVLYTSQAFWDYLKDELKKLRNLDKITESKPLKVAGKIKKEGLAIEQAACFMKSSKRVASEAIRQRNETLEKFGI